MFPSNVEVSEQILLMAFRYAINRNTAAPGEVCRELKINWDKICSEFKRQIKEDIERQIRITDPGGDYYQRVSDDFISMLEWISNRDV